MDSKYKCDKCGKPFKQKSDYARHIARKLPCTGETLEESNKKAIQEAKEKEIKKEERKKAIAELKENERKHICDVLRISLDKLDEFAEHRDINIAEMLLKQPDNPAEKKYWEIYTVPEIKHHCERLNILYPVRNGIEYKSKPALIKKVIANYTAGIARPDVQPVQEEYIMPVNTKNPISTCVNACHDVMRNREALTGSPAMEDITNILFIKFIEPLIDNKSLDIMDKKYYEGKHPRYNERVMLFSKFSYLKSACESGENAIQAFRDLINVVFANHPLTAGLFTNNKFFNCTNGTTLIELMNKISSLSFDETKDNKGAIYEEFINGYYSNGGKEFGQYFTPRPIVDMIIDNMDIKYDNIDAYDPFMGTAGFLMHLYNKYKDKQLKLSGGEIVASTWRFAAMNIILTTNTIDKDAIKCKNSLVECDPTTKYNTILTNIPFGMNLKYKDIESKYKSKYPNHDIKFADIYPVNNTKGTVFAIQMMVYKLAPGGIATTVFPIGSEMSGSNKSLIEFRRHVMKKCVIEKIIFIRGKAFKFAGISTCVLFFRKREADLIEDECEVPCFEVFPEDGYKTLKEMPVLKIDKKHNYSWDPQSYVKQSIEWGDVETKEIGEIFQIKKGKIQSSKHIDKGEYKFITQSTISKWKKTEFYTSNEPSIYIYNMLNMKGNGLNIYFYDGKADHSDLMLSLTPKEEYKNNIYVKLYYYILSDMKAELQNNYYKGTGQKSLDKNRFNQIKIPIPPLEIQKKIADELETINNRIDQFTATTKQIGELIESYEKNIQYKFKKDVERKMLGDVCEIKTGIRITKAELKGGEYPVVNGGVSIMGYHNEYNTEADTIFVSTKGSAGYVSRYTTKTWTSDNCSYLKNIKENMCLKNYIYFYLKSIQDYIYSLRIGEVGAPKLDNDTLLQVEIPIPPIEEQKEIITFYETKQKKIEQLQKQKEEFMSLIDVDREIIQAIMNRMSGN